MKMQRKGKEKATRPYVVQHAAYGKLLRDGKLHWTIGNGGTIAKKMWTVGEGECSAKMAKRQEYMLA